MLYLVIIAVLIVIVLWGRLRNQKRRANINGWVETADLNGKGKHIYRDEKASVSCKPDVVLRDRVTEYKSASVEGKPRWVDMLQLALQLNTTDKSEGELRYSNKSFVFRRDSSEISAAMRNALKIVERMRWHLDNRIAPKATPSRNRCAKCVFMKVCPEATR